MERVDGPADFNPRFREWLRKVEPNDFHFHKEALVSMKKNLDKTMALSRFFFMLTKASLWKWKSFGSTFRSHSRNRGLKSAGPSTLSINFSGLLICRQIGKVRPSTQFGATLSAGVS